MQFLIKLQKLDVFPMDEFVLINKYMKPLTKKNPASMDWSDDIFYDSKKKLGLSVDSYVHGVHFIDTDPSFFLKKILRSSLSDLYCKGIKPKFYFLSLGCNKNFPSHKRLLKIKKILFSEQKKFNIFLSGGDTTFSKNLVITIAVLGYATNKPTLRKGSSINDDIYVTGNIGDSFIGLNIIKRKMNFGKFNSYFKKKFYEPEIPHKITPFLNKIASSSIDISDGLGQDLKNLCINSKHGAYIDLNLLPISKKLANLINLNKLNLRNVFSKGDDYQILFTSSPKNRNKINQIRKKINIKITRIGHINGGINITFKYFNRIFKLKAKNMGFKHKFY